MAEKWRFNSFFTHAQLLRWREQIPKLAPCRDFSGPPKVAQWTTLSYAAARLCLPGVRIVLAACDESFFTDPFFKSWRVKGAVRFAAIIADTAMPRHLTHAGISGEALLLEAASCGAAARWVTRNYRKKESPVRLHPGEVLAAVIPLGLAKEPTAKKPRQLRRPLHWLMEGGGKDWPEHALGAVRAVWEAPSTVPLPPLRLRLASQSLSIMGKPNSIDTGIALLHMEAALCDIPRQWNLEAGVKAPAAKVLFTGPED